MGTKPNIWAMHMVLSTSLNLVFLVCAWTTLSSLTSSSVLVPRDLPGTLLVFWFPDGSLTYCSSAGQGLMGRECRHLLLTLQGCMVVAHTHPQGGKILLEYPQRFAICFHPTPWLMHYPHMHDYAFSYVKIYVFCNNNYHFHLKLLSICREKTRNFFFFFKRQDQQNI